MKGFIRLARWVGKNWYKEELAITFAGISVVLIAGGLFIPAIKDWVKLGAFTLLGSLVYFCVGRYRCSRKL